MMSSLSLSDFELRRVPKNSSTEVGQHPIFFFCSLWKRAVVVV